MVVAAADDDNGSVGLRMPFSFSVKWFCILGQA
jgi:hypothetical protein